MKFLDLFHFFFENEASGKNRQEQQPVQQPEQKSGEAHDNGVEDFDDFDYQEQKKFFD